MRCPICSSDLQPATHEGVELEMCPGGHGLWLQPGELAAVVMKTELDRPEHEENVELHAAKNVSLSDLMRVIREEGDRACPECGSKMQKVEYGFSTAILTDKCSDHGVWLDSGELERIEAYAEGTRRQTGLA